MVVRPGQETTGNVVMAALAGNAVPAAAKSPMTVAAGVQDREVWLVGAELQMAEFAALSVRHRMVIVSPLIGMIIRLARLLKDLLRVTTVILVRQVLVLRAYNRTQLIPGYTIVKCVLLAPASLAQVAAQAGLLGFAFVIISLYHHF